MLPLFGRFKKFFASRYIAARNKRYMLVYKAKSILKRDFLEGSISVVRLGFRGGE